MPLPSSRWGVTLSHLTVELQSEGERELTQMFASEVRKPANKPKKNLVFLGYPYNPALPQADYRAVVTRLQLELPIRLWYCADEVTTAEMMRKVWRAILRSDLAVFDISDGNANVAFELGLATAKNKRCMTLLKRGARNPLGETDFGYSERMEYESANELKAQLRRLLTAHSSSTAMIAEVSDAICRADGPVAETIIRARLQRVMVEVFQRKRITMADATRIMEDPVMAKLAIRMLIRKLVLKQAGGRAGRRVHYALAESWVTSDYMLGNV